MMFPCYLPIYMQPEVVMVVMMMVIIIAVCVQA